MTAPSSLLFFPGTRLALLDKALASGASLVCVDLEDAVASDAKARAREDVVRLLDEADVGVARRLVVRINHPATTDGARDLDAISGVASDRTLAGVLVPKVAEAAELSEVRSRLARGGEAPPMLAMIETAEGVSRVEGIAAADGVVALVFGGLDLSADLGCALEWEPLLYARSRCVLAARLAAVGSIDTPHFDLNDLEGLRLDAARGRGLGFTGKAAIHPRQVPVIERVFVPTEEEVTAARRMLDAQARHGEGVFALDGVMVDRPVLEAARRLVERAERSERTGGA